MISVPLKETVPIDWIGPLRTYLKQVYGSGQDFSAEITALQNLRQDVLGAARHANGRDLLYKYYAQLELLDMRIPVNERGCAVSFVWKGLFDGESVTQYAIAFEKAAVLFNLAAVFSHMGESSPEPKTAFASFQAAAGIFRFISNNFLHAPTIDLNTDTTKTLATQMLAQAQDAFLRKALEGNTKPGVVAKLAQSAANLYTEAADGLEKLYAADQWGEKEWHSDASQNGKLLNAIASYFYALHLDDTGKHGEAIAFIRSAKNQFNLLKWSPKGDEAKPYHELATGKLKTMEKDNDLIYNVIVPPVTTDVPATDVAKPTNIEDIYPDSTKASKVVGNELFAKVIPLEVHERSSLYSEEKTQLMRRERERVEVADQELGSALEFMDLPRSANLLRHSNPDEDPLEGAVPPTVKEWAAEVSSEPLKMDFGAKRQKILDVLSSMVQDSSVSQDVQKIKQCLITGAHTDKQIAESLEEVQGDLDILAQGPTGPVRSLFKFERTQSVDLLDMDDAEQQSLRAELDQVVKQVGKLKKIEKERNVVFRELREKLHQDDISSQLVMNRRATKSDKSLFQDELAKFDPYTERIALTVNHQNTLLGELSSLWKKVLSSKTVKQQAIDRDSALAKQSVLVQRLGRAFDAWLAAKASAAEARSYYNDLEKFAVSVSESALSGGVSSMSLDRTAPKLPQKPNELSGYSVPSAYDSSLYEPRGDSSGPPRPPKPY